MRPALKHLRRSHRRTGCSLRASPWEDQGQWDTLFDPLLVLRTPRGWPWGGIFGYFGAIENCGLIEKSKWHKEAVRPELRGSPRV